MKTKTFASTDWIEVHDFGSSYYAKVFLTHDDNVYMIVRSKNQTRFFKIEKELLALGAIEFFEKVLRNSKELPFEHAYKIGLIDY